MTTLKETLKELEARVEALENELGGRRGPEEGWMWNAGMADRAANALEDAFDWEECPVQPCEFERWEELHEWLSNLEEE